MSEHEDATTESLVVRAQASGPGDHAAYEELVRRHRAKVLANCRFLTRSDLDTEDLAQEVFMKAYFGLKKLKAAATFPSWLQRIKINHCLNFIRKHKDRSFVEVESPGLVSEEKLRVATPVGAELTDRVRENRIWTILYSMSDKLRLPLILCDMDGLSYQEAADELGIGLSALKMRLKRAREHFRKRYKVEEMT